MQFFAHATITANEKNSGGFPMVEIAGKGFVENSGGICDFWQADFRLTNPLETFFSADLWRRSSCFEMIIRGRNADGLDFGVTPVRETI